MKSRVPPLYPLTRAHEVDSTTRWGRHPAAVADSIFAQFGSGPRRSLRRSADRPARAAWAALRPRGAGELRGHRQQAALKDQRFRGRVPPLYPLTRAHEVDSATRWGRHLAAVADSIFAQFGSGPRRSLRRSAERPARAAWAALRPRGAGELRGHRQQAALKDQRFRDVEHNLDMDGVTGSISVPPTRKLINFSMLDRQFADRFSVCFRESRGEASGRGLCPFAVLEAPASEIRPTPLPQGRLVPPRSLSEPAIGLKLHPMQREIAVGRIARSKGASRRTVWQTAGPANPPEPPLATRAKGPSERAIGIEHFDAGAGLWVNVVQRS